MQCETYAKISIEVIKIKGNSFKKRDNFYLRSNLMTHYDLFGRIESLRIREASFS